MTLLHFITILNITTSTASLNHNLSKYLNDHFNWKLILILILARSRVTISLKNKFKAISIIALATTFFQVQLQKHLSLFLDRKLNFDEHIQCTLNKTCKILDWSERTTNNIKGSLDCAFNESFQNKAKFVQYKATLAITGAIRGVLREALPEIRSWIAKFTMVQKIVF